MFYVVGGYLMHSEQTGVGASGRHICQRACMLRGSQTVNYGREGNSRKCGGKAHLASCCGWGGGEELQGVRFLFSVRKRFCVCACVFVVVVF